jgi:dTDP-4-dehydrorhamnose reductase
MKEGPTRDTPGDVALGRKRPLLVIGAAGLVGRAVRTALNDEPVAATRHRQAAEGSRLLDLVDAHATRAHIRELGPRAIILAAAEAHVEHCEREPAVTRRINVDAARVVAEEADRANALFVVFSSEYVFDGTKGRYHEDDPVAPLNEYGRQKVELEAIARDVRRHLIVRTSGVFGPEPAGKNFVLRLERSLRGGRPFVVPVDQLITPTYAPSLGDAVAALIRRGVIGLVHAAGPRILARTEFAAMICAAFGLDPAMIVAHSTDQLGLAAARPRRAGLADDRLRDVIGHPLAEPDQGLREMAIACER